MSRLSCGRGFIGELFTVNWPFHTVPRPSGALVCAESGAGVGVVGMGWVVGGARGKGGEGGKGGGGVGWGEGENGPFTAKVILFSP